MTPETNPVNGIDHQEGEREGELDKIHGGIKGVKKPMNLSVLLDTLQKADMERKCNAPGSPSCVPYAVQSETSGVILLQGSPTQPIFSGLLAG